MITVPMHMSCQKLVKPRVFVEDDRIDLVWLSSQVPQLSLNSQEFLAIYKWVE